MRDALEKKGKVVSRYYCPGDIAILVSPTETTGNRSGVMRCLGEWG